MRKIFSILIFCTTILYSQSIKNFWYQQGPFGGVVKDISISEDNKIAVAANGGVSVLWYDWINVTGANDVKSIEFIPNTSFLAVIKGNKLLKTSDNGYHWFEIFSAEEKLNDFIISKNNPLTIYAWSDSILKIVDYNSAHQSTIVTPGNKINKVAVHPSDSIIFLAMDDGVYTFQNQVFNPLLLTDKPFNSLAISNDFPNYIFAGTSIDDTIYISSDNGSSWHKSALTNDRSVKINQINAHPSLNSRIYAATDNGIFITYDAGSNWNFFSAGLIYNYMGLEKTLGVDNLLITSDNVFAGTIEGLYKTNALQWELIGPYNQQVISLGKNLNSYNERIFAGSLRGIKYSDFNTWYTSSLYSDMPLPINTILTYISSEENVALAAGYNNSNQPQIYQSLDKGEHWRLVFSGDSGAGKVNQLFQKAQYNDIIYALCENRNGNSALLKSESKGDSLSWKLISDVDQELNYAVYNPITEEIYVLANNKDLFQLTTGDTLKFLSTIPGTHYNSLYFDKQGSFLYAVGNGVKRTLDFLEWHEFGLDTFEVVEIVEDWSSLFAATKYNGVYSTFYTDGVWFPFYDGLPADVEITDIINFTHGVLHIATKNNSVFMMYAIINSTDNDNNIPEHFALSQNYPNPFNPITKIKFSIPSSPLLTKERGSLPAAGHGGEVVSLKIYDVLGNEVATLVNEEKPTGEYEVEFDGSSLSSGIYFYTLRAGSFTQTKKLILLK